MRCNGERMRVTIHRIVFLGRVEIRLFQGLANKKIEKRYFASLNMTRKTIRHSEGKPEESVSTMFYRLFHSKDSETSSELQTNDCHPELVSGSGC